MAHWISSKLKAAETLLQQIDQQAAESLGKNEKPLSDDQSGAESSSRNPETKPLIKDQLKKKSSEKVVGQSINSIDKKNLKVFSRSNSVENRDDETIVSPNQTSKSHMNKGVNDGDWTELLSAPDKRGLSGTGSGIRSSNRGSGIRSLKKDGKKVSPRTDPSMVDESKKVGNNGSSKSYRKSSVKLENNSTSADSDATPTTSTVQSPTSGGEYDQRNSGSTLVISDPNLENTGSIEGMNDTANGEKVHSSQMISTSHKKDLDTNVGMDDDERLKNVSTPDSLKKVSISPSDGESNSETDTSSSSDSESEKEREERRKRRQHILAERAAAKAVEAIKERENLFARLEGEKQSLEKILEERSKQQAQEASELQTTMMETMEAVELEKQKHNNTRMEALARLAKLESINADLTRSLANVQKSLEVEVDCVGELRQQIHIKEAAHEELRRKISHTHHNDDKLRAPKAVEFEVEMLEAEYSFINDKVGRMKDKAEALETSIETTQRAIENPTEVEIELKRRLRQLTEHLIMKQSQVESLSSEKAMLLLKTEAVSRMLDEYEPMVDSAEFPRTSSRNNMGSNPNLQSLFKGRMQTGKRHLGSLVRQLDSLFCVGAMFIRRNSTARIWAVVYLACLHVWVMYILMSRSPASDDSRPGAVFSLENINNTGGV